MAGTMQNTKVEFTRSTLIGQVCRIAAVYGASPLGVRVYLAYHAAHGCRDNILQLVVERCRREGVQPMGNTAGRPCSMQWHDRRELTWRERQRRERDARRERGESLDMFTRTQA